MGGKKKGNNKQKNTEAPQQQQQQLDQQQQQQAQQHSHDHHHDHHHDHDNGHCNHNHKYEQVDTNNLLAGLGKPENLLSSLGMLPKLTEMLSQLGNFGGQAFKPDDPIPDFTKFDQTKQTLEIAIEEFQKTIEQISKKDYTGLQKPVVQKQQQPKLTKQQQQNKDRNHSIIKQNIDYLNTLQKELKTLQKEPSLVGILPILNQGVENLNQDLQYYQKQLEV